MLSKLTWHEWRNCTWHCRAARLRLPNEPVLRHRPRTPVDDNGVDTGGTDLHSTISGGAMFNSTHSNSAFCQSQIPGLHRPVGDEDGINLSVETVTPPKPLYLPGVSRTNACLLVTCAFDRHHQWIQHRSQSRGNKLGKRLGPLDICTRQPLVQAIGCFCLR